MGKTYKSKPFLPKLDGSKYAHAELPARLALEQNSWKLRHRLPKVKSKTRLEYVRPECNNNKIHCCFSYLRKDLSRYVPFWEQVQLNRKLPDPLSHFIELIQNQPLYGLCYGCDRRLQKHFHHEKPVRTGGGYTYFSKEACATAPCLCPERSLETYGISEDDLETLTLHIQQLLSLAAETDLLQHMKRLTSCTMVHKTQDKLSLELLKRFLEYDCGLKFQQKCLTAGPNIRRIVEEVPWRSIIDPSEPLNPQHIQSTENSAVLLMLWSSCQLRGTDPKAVMEFLRESLLNKWPDEEEVIQDSSIKTQPIGDDCLVSQRITPPKHFQKNGSKDKRGCKQFRFTDLKNPEERHIDKKEDKLMPVFNPIMMLPKLLREEEEKMLLHYLQNLSREERAAYFRQHGLLLDNLHSPFIPGLSKRPRGLWTEPKAFTVHHEKIFTQPISPFSKDREYDIRSLTANFQVHKSNKVLTKFIKVQLPQKGTNQPVMALHKDSYTDLPAGTEEPGITKEGMGQGTSLTQMTGNLSPSDTMLWPKQTALPFFSATEGPSDDSSASPARCCSQHLSKQSLVPVLGLPESQEVHLSDAELEAQPGEERLQQQLKHPTLTMEQHNLLTKFTIDGEKERETGDFQIQEKRSHSQEWDFASQLDFESESGVDLQTTNDPSEETSLVLTVSLQSTAVCQRRKNGPAKKNKHTLFSIDRTENDMLHQREPDSWVHLETSESTKSHNVQLVRLTPDALEGCEHMCQPKAEKPPGAGDDRQANEKAAEAIVIGQEERRCLPRAVFTKRKPLPSVKRDLWKNSQRARVVMEETQRRRPSILDFLTKYCIIKPERLSFYERIFQKYCNHEDTEVPTNQRSTNTSNIDITYLPGGFDHIEEILIQKKAKENIDIEKKIRVVLESGPVSDQLEKIQFKIKTLLKRKQYIVSTVQELQDQRMALQAPVAKQQSHAAEEKRKKKRRRGKRDTKLVLNMEEKEDNLYKIPSSVLSSVPADVPTEQADANTKIECLDAQIRLFWNKYNKISSRLSELNETRMILEQKNREAYLEAIVQNSKIPPEKRLQSALYCRLHPNKDLALDTNDLEEALQDVNKCLVSPKEFSYIFHILELPGQQRLNLELFCVVAALSEKVTQLDPVIKKLINKLDFEALSVRMEKAKELWHLLQENEGVKEKNTNRRSRGSISIRSLALELAAGGYSLAAINFALQKFNRTEAGTLSFLDFVTYIPLFVEIHEGIVQNPLSLIPNTVPDLGDDICIDVD